MDKGVPANTAISCMKAYVKFSRLPIHQRIVQVHPALCRGFDRQGFRDSPSRTSNRYGNGQLRH